MTGTSLQPWLDRWDLVPDGEPFTAPHTGSRLLFVRARGAPAILKVTASAEEIAGGALMAWWDGQGAAAVMAREGGALLLERATGTSDLARMAREGRDDEAGAILCAAAAALHARRPGEPPATLVPLERWFRDLWPAAESHGGVMAKAAATARRLLDQPREVGVLHGDLHHGNVLDFGERGWLAIDPKGLVGDRGYDHANMLCNPNVETALAAFDRRVAVTAAGAGLEPVRLLSWMLAYCGLSAAWSMADGPGDAAATLRLADRAAGALGL